MRLKWWHVALIVSALLFIGGPLGLYFFFDRSSKGKLQAALADTNRGDPAWRWEELLKARAAILDAENGAKRVKAAFGLLPGNWPGPKDPEDESDAVRGSELYTQLVELPPETRLSAPQLAGLRADLDAVAPALEQARKLTETPTGRFDLAYHKLAGFTPLDDIIRTRDVSRLLRLDTIRRVEEGDADGAVDSCRAILNAGRAIGDEPFMMAQQIRSACASTAVKAIERVLAQSRPSEAALAKVQALLELESQHNGALVGIRGERATMDLILGGIADGSITTAELFAAQGVGPVNAPTIGFIYRTNQEFALTMFGEALTIVRRPIPEQWDAWDAWKQDVQRTRNSGIGGTIRALSALSLEAVPGMVSGLLVARAHLGCSLLMVAAERHRLKHGAWPNSAESIDPAICPQPPRDIYVDEPLKVEAVEGGLKVFSVGPEKTPDGTAKNTRMQVIYRLVDPDRRGQTPATRP